MFFASDMFHTDKSKKLSIDKPSSYKESMEPHVEGEREVDQRFVTKTVTKYNEINKSLVKVLGIGKMQWTT